MSALSGLNMTEIFLQPCLGFNVIIAPLGVAPPTYSVTVQAYCNIDSVAVNVAITKDGSPSGKTTPYVFSGLTGIHTFTVPSTDPHGHSFANWSSGETSLTITVSYAGTFTAYYGVYVPPPPPVVGILPSVVGVTVGFTWWSQSKGKWMKGGREVA
jgi:hypothetical protein